jgi:chemotaxis protein methyltransferase CheR
MKTVPSNVIEELQDYPWPGNVRELENVIERAVIFTQGSRLRLAAPLTSDITAKAINQHLAPMKTLADMEKEYILRALNQTDWNVAGKGGAADLLGLNSSTLRGRMRKHDIHRPSNHS